MARPRRIDLELLAKARVAVAQAKDPDQLRAAQAVLLPALANTTLEETAALLGVGRASLPRLQRRFREGLQLAGEPRNWGGRRRSLMTVEEEKAFLAPWTEQARKAGMIVVSPLRAALADKLGRNKVTHSVVYRLLTRHGWRKVAPDTRHPKSDATAQIKWKNNFRKHWQPLETKIWRQIVRFG